MIFYAKKEQIFGAKCDYLSVEDEEEKIIYT